MFRVASSWRVKQALYEMIAVEPNNRGDPPKCDARNAPSGLNDYELLPRALARGHHGQTSKDAENEGNI
jgi:hypothetical protein